jgi:mannose-1-phosphate guanylyltransferase/phosphomannomutase
LKAVVLAGGKGTRLRPLTYTKPKPLLPLAGEPAIVRLVHKLARDGIDDVIVTTNYFAKLLRETLGDGSDYGLRIHHVEEKTPLGTAGSVKNSESLIDETFIVVQGDNQFEFRLEEIVSAHRKLGPMATMALVRVENPSEYGIVELSDGRVTRFLEKPAPHECFSNLINAGIYVVEPDALRLIPEGKPFDFSRDLFPHMLKSRIALGGCPVGGFWVDVGDPGSYLKANCWALDTNESKHTPRPSNSIISKSATLKGPICLGDNVRIHKDVLVGPYACIGDGSEISAGAKITFSVVYENTQIGANAVLDTCIVAEMCKIGDRVQIERNTLIGAGTELGKDSRVLAESKVGPFAVVKPRAVVQGTLTPFANDIEKVSQLVEKSRLGVRLTVEEARVCGVLCELGEADASSVSRFANVPQSTADSILISLQERGIVISFGNVPRVYSLSQEDLEHARKEN